MKEIELIGTEALFGQPERMFIEKGRDAGEEIEGYLSAVRQDEVRGERHAYRKVKDDAYQVRPDKVSVKKKFRTKKYRPKPGTLKSDLAKK